MEQQLENIKICPICSGTEISESLKLKDYFLSQELFTIQKCNTCGFQFTNPRPKKEFIAPYYKSENYISHSNKSKGVFAILYQKARKINLNSKYKVISKHKEKGKALDIGSGTGHFLNYLEKKGWNVKGIEPDAASAEFARSNFNLEIDKEQKLKEFENESFDLITMWHVLEHVHNLNERMEDLKRLIKSDGLIILALPNRESYDANYYDKYWAAYDVPRHLYHFTKRDVDSLAIKHNLVVKQVYSMNLDAFYVSLLSEKYKKNSFGYFRAFITSFVSNLKSKAKNPNTSSLIYLLQKNRG